VNRHHETERRPGGRCPVRRISKRVPRRTGVHDVSETGLHALSGGTPRRKNGQSSSPMHAALGTQSSDPPRCGSVRADTLEAATRKRVSDQPGMPEGWMKRSARAGNRVVITGLGAVTPLGQDGGRVLVGRCFWHVGRGADDAGRHVEFPCKVSARYGTGTAALPRPEKRHVACPLRAVMVAGGGASHSGPPTWTSSVRIPRPPSVCWWARGRWLSDSRRARRRSSEGAA